MRSRLFHIAALALVALLIAGGCADDETAEEGTDVIQDTAEDASSTSEGESSTSAEPTSSSSEGGATTSSAVETTTSEGTVSENIEDGRHFGYVQSVTLAGDGATAEFDLAEFYTGEEANQAAIDDGVIGAGETVDNDYYIRNQNPQLRTLVIDVGASVTIIEEANCCESAPLALVDLPSHIATESGFWGYWVSIVDGLVVEIEEQYTP